MTGSIALRHLTFTGDNVPDAGLGFDDGLNVLYGSSNTGKSFVWKAMDFMLGGSRPLPGLDEAAPYEAVWLGLRLQGDRTVTLSRSTKGMGFTLYPGLVTCPVAGGVDLAPTHDPKTASNLSMYLLGLLGLDGKLLVKNASGEKDSLSFRHVAPYLFTSEETIISENSPVLASGQHHAATVEKNVFRLLLTGIDDRHVVATIPRKTQAAMRTGKLELLDDWIARLDRELGDPAPDRGELRDRSDRLAASAAALRQDLRDAQDRIDVLFRERRRVKDALAETTARVADLDLTLDRFGRLDEVYGSDLERLAAIEEGGALLLAFGLHECPVCGAPPEAHTKSHGSDEIAVAGAAASAEIRKIQRDKAELARVVASLSSEARALRLGMEASREELRGLEADLDAARPAERDFRLRYEESEGERRRIGRLADLFDRRDRFAVERSQLDVPVKTRRGADVAIVGVDGLTAHAYAETVQNILEAWRFPGRPKVNFDLETQDIRLNGKKRSDNGKGVRALLHAAMKVAVLLYCHEHGRPHPGFVVLDTPLLTYREPATSRHGELAPDEAALAGSGIASRFYAYVASLSEIGQFLVIENPDPPTEVRALGRMQEFTGQDGSGRYGFFPRR